MEKIDKFERPFLKNPKDKKKKVFSGQQSRGISFSSIYETSQAGKADEALFPDLDVDESEIVSLLDDIHEIGEEVKKNPTIEVIKKYKAAVRTFLSLVIRHSYSVEKTKVSGFNVLKSGGQRELTTIKKIDEKLEKLAAGVLQNQKNQFDILSKVDEIYGLIVDLIR